MFEELRRTCFATVLLVRGLRPWTNRRRRFQGFCGFSAIYVVLRRSNIGGFPEIRKLSEMLNSGAGVFWGLRVPDQPLAFLSGSSSCSNPLILISYIVASSIPSLPLGKPSRWNHSR